MKYQIALAAVAVLTTSQCLCAQGNLQETILEQEKAFIDAVQDKDWATVSRLLAEEKYSVIPGGKRQTRSETLQRLKGSTIASYSVEDVKCVEISPDAGILTYKFTWTGTRNGKLESETSVLATATWVRRDGKWKAVFYQETPINDVAASDGDVKEAATRFVAALNELFAGNIEPMGQVWSHADDVTYMGPAGGLLVGWDQVHKSWEQQASLQLGGEVKCEDMRITAGPEIGVVSCRVTGTNYVEGKPQPVSIRATSTYRKESGEWKMIGHHTDLLPFLSR